jgi:hypothetical protein
MAKMNTHVWVFDAEATGPGGGDYDGRQSVHATRHSAELALFDFIHGLGVDPRDTSATDAYVDEYKDLDGEIWQVCGTVETVTGWNAHYGIRRTEVRA